MTTRGSCFGSRENSDTAIGVVSSVYPKPLEILKAYPLDERGRSARFGSADGCFSNGTANTKVAYNP
jgi:hypothetical protein